MNKNNLNIGAILSIVLVMVIGISAIFYYSRITAIRHTRAEIVSITEREAGLSLRIYQTPRPEAELERLQKESRVLAQRLPDESRISWMSAMLAKSMQYRKLDLRSTTDWNDAGPGPKENLRRLFKTVCLCGSAKDFQAFLQDIDNLPFAVLVDDVSVARDGNGGTITATVKLGTFVLRTPGPMMQDKT